MSLQKNALIAAGVAASFFLLMPQERLDAVGETLGRLVGRSAQLCLDYERKELKDPDSAKLLSSNGDGYGASITYKAKNSYGAYVTKEAICAVSGWTVDEERTKQARFNAELARENVRMASETDRMKKENKCVGERNDLMRSGMNLAAATKALGGCKYD